MNLKNCVSGDVEVVARWHQICDEHESDKRKWIEALRSSGYKAAHPNDGWVNWETHELLFAYPQFNDGAGMGDSVMLGWHYDKESLRPVCLVGYRASITGLIWWKFVDTHALTDKVTER